MALHNCPHCGHIVSDKAERCPGCGAPVVAAEFAAEQLTASVEKPKPPVVPPPVPPTVADETAATEAAVAAETPVEEPAIEESVDEAPAVETPVADEMQGDAANEQENYEEEDEKEKKRSRWWIWVLVVVATVALLGGAGYFLRDKISEWGIFQTTQSSEKNDNGDSAEAEAAEEDADASGDLTEEAV